MLKNIEKRALLALARSVISAKLNAGYKMEPELAKVVETAPLFREKRGAFVTVHKNGALRGGRG